VGSAYTFLLPREKAPFFRMRKKVDSKRVNPLEVTEEEYANLMDRYSLVLQELQASLVVSDVFGEFDYILCETPPCRPLERTFRISSPSSSMTQSLALTSLVA
jgi:hypothetical protein